MNSGDIVQDIHQRPTPILNSVQLLCQGTILNTENSFFKGFYNNRRIYRERPATITKYKRVTSCYMMLTVFVVYEIDNFDSLLVYCQFVT